MSTYTLLIIISSGWCSGCFSTSSVVFTAPTSIEAQELCSTALDNLRGYEVNKFKIQEVLCIKTSS